MQITLHDESHRKRAHALIDAAPDRARVTVAEPKRSDLQSAKMWAMIGDIMRQAPDWFGPGLDKDDIKQVFISALFKELRMARNADGDGFVPLVRRSSNLSVREMADLITLIEAWGVQHGVVWIDPEALSAPMGDLAMPPLPADLDIPHGDQEAIHATEVQVRGETREAVRPDSGGTVAFDPLAWSTEFEAGLAGWTDPDLLKEEWAELEATRGLLKAASESNACRLHDLVMLHIKELRAATKSA